MHQDEPGAETVNEVVQEVSVGDAIDGGVDGEGEEEDVGYEAGAAKRNSDISTCAYLQKQVKWGEGGKD